MSLRLTSDDQFEIDHPKMRKIDRIIKLEPQEGVSTKNAQGLVDNRLWKGGNNLHAIQTPDTNLWYCKYEAGSLPEPLRQKFTSFKKLYEFVERYFAKRNIKITEVID